jgi:hypothetical protein
LILIFILIYVILVTRKEVTYMRCEYRDGFKVDYEDYAGSLRITKGNDVEISVQAGQISGKARSDLDAAANHNSCSELRAAAREVTDALHEAWDKP